MVTAGEKVQMSQGQKLHGQIMTWELSPNLISLSWAYVPNFRPVL